MDPSWLSNAYVVGDEVGGKAVFVDSGAPLEPLFEAVERDQLTVTHLLTTHADPDHVAGDDQVIVRYGVPVVKGPLETGGLAIDALPTPGHKDDHLAFVVNGEACFSGDVLFKDAVGGGNLEQIRRSVMDVLMKLPPETRVLPGHADETLVGRDCPAKDDQFFRRPRELELLRDARFAPMCRHAGFTLVSPSQLHDILSGGEAHAA